MLAGLDEYYYNNRDLRLLLDLLAVRSGCADSLRVLALFDKGLSKKFKAGDLDLSFLEFHKRKAEINIWNVEGKITQKEDENKTYDISVKFSSAPAIKEIVSRLKDVTWMYTVEIQPPTLKSSVKPAERMDKDHNNGMHEEGKDGTEMTELTQPKSNLMGAILEDLDTSTEYSISVSTIVNGRTLAQRSERIKPKKQ